MIWITAGYGCENVRKTAPAMLSAALGYLALFLNIDCDAGLEVHGDLGKRTKSPQTILYFERQPAGFGGS